VLGPIVHRKAPARTTIGSRRCSKAAARRGAISTFPALDLHPPR
jgi:hypothetical protein